MRSPLPTFAARLSILLSAVLLTAQALQAAERLPNVILIVADDLGYADVGVYGAQGFATPNFDRLAQEGRRFTDFHVAQAVCSASRAAIMTGCYPNRIGIEGAMEPWYKFGINEHELTMPQMFQQKGYATGMVGKWHLGTPTEFLPTHRGFDEWFGLPYSNDQWPLHPEKPGKFPPLPLYDGDKIVNPGISHRDMEQLTTQYTERAVSFIDRNHDKPFFLYVAQTMPHVPLAVSEKFRGTTKRGLYGDAVEEIDWSTGEILTALKKHGLEKDTIIIFLSDNGPWLIFGNHAGSAYPLREGKTTTWDGGTRVPFIISWPGHIPAGTTCDEMACAIDLLPALAKLISAKLPDHKIDGLDIWPLLAGDKDARNPHEAYFFYGVPFGSWSGAELESVRLREWKLILPHTFRTLGGHKPGMDGWPAEYVKQPILEPELYDMRNDIEEKHDVAGQHREIVKHLLDLAEQCRIDLGDTTLNRKGMGVRAPGGVKD
ncbi:MAG: sulfatase [Chthoniobacter sp.]|uniref:sulfatase family protein n=1 Tax=Chthoniobacter sp. TaxID=2510640 RepID=UPI0032AD8D20